MPGPHSFARAGVAHTLENALKMGMQSTRLALAVKDMAWRKLKARCKYEVFKDRPYTMLMRAAEL